MKQATDNTTAELPGVPSLPKRRGRPPSGSAMTGADRIRKYREQKELVTLTVDIPAQLLEQFNEFLKFKGKTKSEVIGALLSNQLLRKR